MIRKCTSPVEAGREVSRGSSLFGIGRTKEMVKDKDRGAPENWYQRYSTPYTISKGDAKVVICIIGEGFKIKSLKSLLYHPRNLAPLTI